jgi:hypothetical protein
MPFVGYFEEMAELRQILDSRYDDLKSGRMKPISGDDMKARLRARSAARQSVLSPCPPGSAAEFAPSDRT